jgi:diphosphomevalonate decarboxylase
MTSIYRYTWQSPSNIALVKYWGKKSFQLPANPSISFTLKNSHTRTSLSMSPKAKPELGIEVYVDSLLSGAFKPKVEKFLQACIQRYPLLADYDYRIDTTNTFPHSSGIASSASGMSALALCICSFLDEQGLLKQDFHPEASYLARMGSGSASRSMYGGMCVWGKSVDFEGSSDEYAIPVHGFDSVFSHYQDTILLIHKGTKHVSSTVGHSLLNNHPFATQRFEQAHKNMALIKSALQSGDLDAFISIVELEALTLHALMMSSTPSFLLMKPNTLAAIEAIRRFRMDEQCPVCFTLDAGANVHVLYPLDVKTKVLNFVKNELASFCEDGAYLCDEVGKGPNKN